MSKQRLKRLSNSAVEKDHNFDLKKVVKDFKKKHNINPKDLKNKTTQNPMYQLWSDYLLENYPVWAMSSPAYMLRGWGYLVGSGLYGGGWYGWYDSGSSSGDVGVDSSGGGDFGGVE